LNKEAIRKIAEIAIVNLDKEEINYLGKVLIKISSD